MDFIWEIQLSLRCNPAVGSQREGKVIRDIMEHA